MIRFSPRKPISIWSAVNHETSRGTRRSGLDETRGHEGLFVTEGESGREIYSYEQRSTTLPDSYEKIMKANEAAWDYFQAQPPSYRKTAFWWVVSAKKEETRHKRLDKLVEYSAQAKRLV